MSDGELANHWPATSIDAPSWTGTSEPVPPKWRALAPTAPLGAADLAGIVQRMTRGDGTLRDRLALVDLASEIETDAPGTELAELAQALRRLAGV